MQIQLLSNQTITKTNKAGKPMQVLEVAYKNLSFNGKVEAKQLFDFGVQKDSFKALAVGQTGQVYEIDVVKNDAGYNDWVKVSKSDGPSTVSSGTNSSALPVVVKGANAAPKSTYETPEERAKKQIYIVRQSSISNAIDLLSVGAKSQPKIEAVIETAKQFEDYVFGTGSKPTDAVVAQDVGAFDGMAEDVPF